MEIILNRLRGTGDIFKIGNFRITGTILYAIYFFILTTLLSTWYYGILIAALFLVGESFAWGKWVGTLCYLKEECDFEGFWNNKAGSGFPFIHQVSNAIFPQRDESDFTYDQKFKRVVIYSNIALFIRGFIYFAPIYFAFAVIGLISFGSALGISLFLAVGFNIACYLSNIFNFDFKIGVLTCIGNWERQEIFYGIFQFVANLILIALIIL